MAFDDVPLEDAGRDYYARQFGHRVQNIRKYGNAPARPAGGGNRWKVIGGAVAALIVVRIIITVVVAVGDWDSTDNDAYQTQAPASPSPMIWNDDRLGEPQPWQMQQPDNPDLQPDVPLFQPDEPLNLNPEQAPVAPEERQRPDKDD